MTWIVDVLLVVIVATAAYIGYKKGIVKMLMNCLTVVLSVGLAYLLSAPLARLFYQMFFEKTISATVDAALESQTVHSAGDAIAALLGPDSVLHGLAGWLQFDPQTVASVASGESLGAIALAVKTQLIMPAMTLLLQILIFILLFFLIWLLLSIAASALCRLAKSKEVRGVNALLGGAVGLLIGVLFAVGVCLLLTLWMQINPQGLFGIDQTVQEQSVIYHLVHTTLLHSI